MANAHFPVPRARHAGRYVPAPFPEAQDEGHAADLEREIDCTKDRGN